MVELEKARATATLMIVMVVIVEGMVTQMIAVLEIHIQIQNQTPEKEIHQHLVFPLRFKSNFTWAQAARLLLNLYRSWTSMAN